MLTRELYKHYVKETIVIPQYDDTDEQNDHVSTHTTVHTAWSKTGENS